MDASVRVYVSHVFGITPCVEPVQAALSRRHRATGAIKRLDRARHADVCQHCHTKLQLWGVGGGVGGGVRFRICINRCQPPGDR